MFDDSVITPATFSVSLVFFSCPFVPSVSAGNTPCVSCLYFSLWRHRLFEYFFSCFLVSFSIFGFSRKHTLRTFLVLPFPWKPSSFYTNTNINAFCRSFLPATVCFFCGGGFVWLYTTAACCTRFPCFLRCLFFFLGLHLSSLIYSTHISPLFPATCTSLFILYLRLPSNGDGGAATSKTGTVPGISPRLFAF